MKNVEMEIHDKKLVITVDLEQDFGKSSSGKTTIVATTSGNVPLPAPHEDFKLGLNIYKK